MNQVDQMDRVDVQVDLLTPALVLDLAVLERDWAAMAEGARRQGVRLRPHLRSSKCAEVAAIAPLCKFGGITVSTVAGADYFAGHHYRDLTYAVGIAQKKIT